MFPHLDFHELLLTATQTVLFTQKIYPYSYWEHSQIKGCCTNQERALSGNS